MAEVLSRRPHEVQSIDTNRQMVSDGVSAGLIGGQAGSGLFEAIGAGSQVKQGGIDTVYNTSTTTFIHNGFDSAGHYIHHLLAKDKLSEKQELWATRGLYGGLVLSQAMSGGDAVATLTKNSARALDKLRGVTNDYVSGGPLHSLYNFMSSTPGYSIHAFDEKNATWFHQATSVTGLAVTALSAAIVGRAARQKYGSIEQLVEAKGKTAVKDQDRYDHLQSDVRTTALSTAIMLGSEHAPELMQEPIRTVASLLIAKVAMKYITRFLPTDRNIKRGETTEIKIEEVPAAAHHEESHHHDESDEHHHSHDHSSEPEHEKPACLCGHDSKEALTPRRRKLKIALAAAALVGGTLLGLASSEGEGRLEASPVTTVASDEKLKNQVEQPTVIIREGDSMWNIIKQEGEKKGYALSDKAIDKLVRETADKNRQVFPDENRIQPEYGLIIPAAKSFEQATL